MFMFRSQLISWRLRDSVVTNTLQTVFELCNRLQNYLFQNKQSLGHRGIGTCSYMQYIGTILWQKGFFPDAVPTKLFLFSRVAGSSYQYPIIQILFVATMQKAGYCESCETDSPTDNMLGW